VKADLGTKKVEIAFDAPASEEKDQGPAGGDQLSREGLLTL